MFLIGLSYVYGIFTVIGSKTWLHEPFFILQVNTIYLVHCIFLYVKPYYWIATWHVAFLGRANNSNG